VLALRSMAACRQEKKSGKTKEKTRCTASRALYAGKRKGERGRGEPATSAEEKRRISKKRGKLAHSPFLRLAEGKRKT